jgi:hypothetical protein
MFLEDDLWILHGGKVDSADGNAVSQDTLVGPPDRVTWVAAATSEVDGMVTAGGRKFSSPLKPANSFCIGE